MATNEDELRTTVHGMLAGVFPDVWVNDYGSIMVQLPRNPVKCVAAKLPEGSLVVNLESPVLLDVPKPQPDVFQLLCLLQSSVPFGSIVTVSSSAGDVHLAIRGQLLADGLTTEALTKAVTLVHAAALDEIDRFRRISPPLGGQTAYEG